MQGYWERAPAARLRRTVSALWVWEGQESPVTFRVVPDGCIDILFARHSGPSTDGGELSVVGTMTRPIEVSRRGVPLLIGARFRPGGAAAFLRCRAADITDQRLSLDSFWGYEARTLLQRLEEAGSVRARLTILEGTLIRRLGDIDGVDHRILHASRVLLERGPATPLAPLACELGLSARQFRRRFEAAVGIGPKHFTRVLRFQRILAAALEGDRDWAELALDAGYYDQAHMINDFREFTGLSPTQYFARR